MTTHSLNPGRQLPWQAIAAASLLLFWLFLLYGRALYQGTPADLRWLWTLLGPLSLTLDFLNPVFWSPSMFAGSYLLGLGLVVWAVVRIVRAWPARLLYSVGGIGALAFPLCLPVVYGRYHPPVKAAAEGYELRWLTQPANPYSSALKQAQLIHEGECDQHLAGWSTQGSLVYTSECWPGAWRYDPGSGQTRWLPLAGRVGRSGASDVQHWVGQVYLSPPPSLTEAGRYPYLTLERSPSPDGRWEAVVVRWFYGPSDVVLIGPA